MLSVRPLDAGDSLDELTVLLHRAYAELGAQGLNYTAVDQSVDVTRKRLAGAHALVALWRGGLVGTLTARAADPESPCPHYRRAGVVALTQFGVDPLFRGRGVGRALMAEAARWARTQGHTELALDTAEPAQHLLALYSRMGFGPVGHTQWAGKVYRSVVMALKL